MLLQRNTSGYLIVDTLMLGACGIFDLFWWSILGEMLDHSDNPSQPSASAFPLMYSVSFAGSVLGMP